MSKQMNEVMAAMVNLSLAQHMETWFLAAEREGLELPWVGDNTAKVMADAAFSVLRGLDDTQSYLMKEKLMQD